MTTKVKLHEAHIRSQELHLGLPRERQEAMPVDHKPLPSRHVNQKEAWKPSEQ